MKLISPNILNGVEDEYSPEKSIKDYKLRLTSRVFVLDKDNNIGLIRHKDEMLFPPGGGVGEGETIFDGSKREVAEELGVVCEPIEDIGILEQYHEKWQKKFIIHHVYATTNRQKIKVDHEEYDTDLERVWMNIEEYRSLLTDYVENKKPDDIWAKAILYFLNDLIIYVTDTMLV